MTKLKFIIDENIGLVIARWFEEKNFDVITVASSMQGASDDEVLNRAFEENRILITNDKDFGEKVFNQKRQHCGIVLLRLQVRNNKNEIRVLEDLFKNYIDKLCCNYVVVTDSQIKITKQSLH